MTAHLLPPNATELDKAFSLAFDPAPELAPAIDAVRGAKLVAPPPSWLPWLVYEYGLGELTPYVPNLYDLIREGIDWQRIRGTPAALAMGLGWIGYAGDIEEWPTRRRAWSRFQLRLDRVRDTEDPDLERIEGIATLSPPLRSRFWRGFHGYDVRPLDWSWQRWSGARWASFSGVRLHEGGPKWSFGRTHDVDRTLGQAELEAAGAWIAPTGGASLSWGPFPWTTPGIAWTDSGEEARRRAIAANLAARDIYVALIDGDGQVIGYRRARAVHAVSLDVAGAYEVDGVRWAPDEQGTAIYVEALTGFGDGAGADIASVALAFDATPADPARPGLLWAGPGELVTPTGLVAETPAAIALGETVRERIRFILRS
ncbi:hypothetical protein HW532_19155 [Kaustia mangrovi]|uniref:Phage tail protein n=1 Tax=Kaustia mangrovi TaxID=2593653 RepID=A0A7S8C7A1_9HYPH|nr:phage tail protein [Kaustia mangrovi]QPC44631.1 hypothetical protein HW532_19155 [Kaustia mangrovi]